MTASSIDPAASEPLLANAVVRLVRHPDGVFHLRLDRPETSNSLDIESLPLVRDAVLAVHHHPAARALLITAAGKNFCGGGDVKVFREQNERLPDYIRLATTLLSQLAQALIHLKVPVVAAITGFAAGGGGLGLVCAADIVVAGNGAKFMAGATRVAMVPDAGVTASLSRLVGFRRAMEIVLLNRVVDAGEALAIGLVNRVVPDASVEAEAHGIAREIAAGAPLAMGMAKRLMWAGMEASPDAMMPHENAAQAMLCGTRDALEGLDAVVERRPPEFRGR